MPPKRKRPPRLADRRRRQYDSLTRSALRLAAGRDGVSTGALDIQHLDGRDRPPPPPPAPEPQEWYQKKSIVETSKVINGIACVLGIFYAGLAIKSVSKSTTFTVFSGVSTFITGVPLSWYFTIKLIDATIRLKKKEPLYMTAYFLGLALAIGSTGAGLQLAKESADSFGEIPDWLRVISMAFFSYNRFCTRFVGSLKVLDLILNFFIDQYYKHFTDKRIYYQLLYDIKHYAHENQVRHALRLGDGPNIKTFAQNFYENMSRLPTSQHPGEAPARFLYKLFIRTATLAIISVFIVNMQPLWLKLSSEGIHNIKAIQSWSNNSAAVWFAALSNEHFYLYMATIFLPSISSLARVTGPKIKTKLNEAGAGKKFLILLGATLAIATWALSSYFSGNSYIKDAKEAMQDNSFGKIADETWFSWFAGSWTQLFMPVYSDLIASTSSGLIVNGVGTISFLMEYVAFFKPVKPDKDYSQFDSDDATRVLLDAIRKHDFKRFERRSGENIAEVIKQKRDAAEPHASLWSKIPCCRKREAVPDTIPLVRAGSEADRARRSIDRTRSRQRF